MSQIRGTIFDIQGFSVYDGPGCRTMIFIKGCPMKCKWCENPEGRETYPVPMYNKSKCLYGGACKHVCPYNAISIRNSTLNIDRKKCKKCEKHYCEEVCDTGALKISGYMISVDELIKKIDRDRKYWGDGGGITLTGGEPFSQPEFTYEILRQCHEKYIHTAVETCGNVLWENIRKTLSFIDWIFFDIKHLDLVRHKVGTGCCNTGIIKNLLKLAEEFKQRLIMRMVIIPGYNDSDKHIIKFAKLINSTNRRQKEVNILPVHNLAKEKYNMLEEDYSYKKLSGITGGKLEKVRSIIQSFGIKCYIGGNTPF